jgi:amino acid transporter
MWQYSGADRAVALAGAVESPKRALGRGLAVSQILIGISIIFGVVLAAALGAGRDFGVATLQIPMCENGWLSVWIRACAAAGALAANVAAVAAGAHETAAAGTAGFLPLGEIVGRRDASFGDETIPAVAVFVIAILSLPLSLVSFERILRWAAAFRALQGLVVCATFIALRMPARADIVRRRHREANTIGEEFVIPGGWIVAVVVVGLVAAACVTVLVFSGAYIIGTTAAMIAGMSLLNLAELGVRRFIEWVKKKRAENPSAAHKGESGRLGTGGAGSDHEKGEEEDSLSPELDDDE